MVSILNCIVLTIYNLILGIPMFTIQKTTLITQKNILMFAATALKIILGLTTLWVNKFIKTNFENAFDFGFYNSKFILILYLK